jgi:hypothetical protein
VMHSSRLPFGYSSKNTPDYHRIFVGRVHQLIHLGYQRLNPAHYAKTEEPAITGDLAKAIDDVLSNPAEDWMHFFSVHDDPHENDGRRKGKQRKRVDLRIDSSTIRPRARFRFEAKRLGKRHRVAVYVGAEGLGCFLRGDYAPEEDHAGMLGYVQSGDLLAWGDKISEALSAAPSDYQIDASFPFERATVSFNPSFTLYQSKHARPTIGRTILVDHILIRFY